MNAAQHILIAGIQIYRWALSPVKTFVFGAAAGCRYSPSCSEYAAGCVREYGAVKGIWLAAKRLGRCHPWGGCGWDPVPKRAAGSACGCRADSGHPSRSEANSPGQYNTATTASFSGTRSA